MSKDSQAESFDERRERLKQRIDVSDETGLKDQPARREFFYDVYEGAGGDEAAVPWADLCAKPELIDWLKENSIERNNKQAIDVACGLGDHANLLAESGYDTIGFDLVPSAVKWAQKRFPQTKAKFQAADLFQLPREWHQKFDLVYECYTIQALAPKLQLEAAKAVASLVAKGGVLLVYSRVREEGQNPKSPPYPLPPSIYDCFIDLGFELKARKSFNLEKQDGRKIPHIFDEWVKL